MAQSGTSSEAPYIRHPSGPKRRHTVSGGPRTQRASIITSKGLHGASRELPRNAGSRAEAVFASSSTAAVQAEPERATANASLISTLARATKAARTSMNADAEPIQLMERTRLSFSPSALRKVALQPTLIPTGAPPRSILGEIATSTPAPPHATPDCPQQSCWRGDYGLRRPTQHGRQKGQTGGGGRLVQRGTHRPRISSREWAAVRKLHGSHSTEGRDPPMPGRIQGQEGPNLQL